MVSQQEQSHEILEPSSKYPFAINARDIKSCVSRFNFTQICVINYYLQNFKKNKYIQTGAKLYTPY